MKKNNKNKGAVTLELLIAFAILVINITAIVLLINGGQSIYIDSETNSEAISKAESLLDEAKSNADIDFNLVNPTTTTETSGNLTYTKKLDVVQTDLFTKEVTSTISWLAEGGRTLNIVLKTLLTNPDAVDGGDTCNSVLSGDWTSPRIVTYKYKPNGDFDYICLNGKDEEGHNCEDGYEFGRDILNDESSGFPVTSIQTFNEKMYVTVNNTKGNNDETFFILDLSDTPELNSTHVLGKLDNSPTTENDISEGLNSVAVNGENYAYVANAYDSSPADCEVADNCAQLQVIDISTPSNPSRIKDFKIDSVATSGKLAYAKSIFYQNEILYLGLAQADGNEDYPNGHEFYVIDVSDSTDPQILDSAEISNGVNSILVRNGYAYIASPNNQELRIFDVSNPSSIFEPPNSGFNAPNNNGNGKSIYIVGNKLYLGRTVNNDNEFYILDNTNTPSIPSTPLGVKNITSSINGLLIRDDLAFFITNTELQTWKISDPNNITQYANPLTLPPGSGNVQGSATDCEGNYIYIGSQKEAQGGGGQDKGYISIITSTPYEE